MTENFLAISSRKFYKVLSSRRLEVKLSPMLNAQKGILAKISAPYKYIRSPDLGSIQDILDYFNC